MVHVAGRSPHFLGITSFRCLDQVCAKAGCVCETNVAGSLQCVWWWVVCLGRFDPQFVEERRKGLEKFLNSVVNHIYCRFDKQLQGFLENGNQEFLKPWFESTDRKKNARP